MGENEDKKSIMDKLKGLGQNVKEGAINEALKNIKIGNMPLEYVVSVIMIKFNNIEKLLIAAQTTYGLTPEYDQKGNIVKITINKTDGSKPTVLEFL
jgi:hypothetical protein